MYTCIGLSRFLMIQISLVSPIVTGGVVEIRDWTQEIPGPRGKKGDPARKKRRSEALWKTSLCWFHLHHPDGCPVSVEQCPFAHGEDELKERPTAEYLGSL